MKIIPIIFLALGFFAAQVAYSLSRKEITTNTTTSVERSQYATGGEQSRTSTTTSGQRDTGLACITFGIISASCFLSSAFLFSKQKK